MFVSKLDNTVNTVLSRGLLNDLLEIFNHTLWTMAAEHFKVEGNMTMNEWSLFEWIVFVLGLIWALMTNIHVRQHYKTSNMPMIPANTFAMVQTTGLVTVAITHYSPLHLLWLFLISYVLGFFALKIKILGRLAWLYGYLISYTILSNW